MLVSYKEKPYKRNGFTWPPHPLQISTTIFFLYNILTYYIVITPALMSPEVNMHSQILAGVLGSIYGILTIIMTVYTFQTTMIDPTDVTVYLEREAQVKGYDVVEFDVN